VAVDCAISLDVTAPLGESRLELRAEIHAGSAAIVGPSGSGKTSCLRVLAGLERRCRGRVAVGGEVWQDSDRRVFVPPWRRGVGWVPQEAHLFPHRTVRENLRWVRCADDECARVAALLGIEHLLDRRPRHLSGGERQRVALGRALLARPRLLLLDEPFAALDRPLRIRTAQAVATFCADRGLPLVLVSHDEGDVTALAEEVWIMDAGRLRPSLLDGETPPAPRPDD
jgi:molybdate transport system ATP-binding protein